jgi:hypothetical protein
MHEESLYATKETHCLSHTAIGRILISLCHDNKHVVAYFIRYHWTVLSLDVCCVVSLYLTLLGYLLLYIYIHSYIPRLPFDIWRLTITLCRSLWPRSLRRRSVATELLITWVRIPRRHGCVFVVSVVCCQVEVSASGWSLVQRSPTDCGASCMI